MLFQLVLLSFLVSAPNAPLEELAPMPKEVQAPKMPPSLKRVQVPTEAIALAEADVKTLPIDARLLTRYIWLQETTPEKVDAIKLALGFISLASRPVQPTVIADGHLIRVNLSLYAPRFNDLQLWIDTWELMQFDPAFSQLITKDNIDFLKQFDASKVPVVQIKVRSGVDGKKKKGEKSSEVGKSNGFWSERKT